MVQNIKKDKQISERPKAQKIEEIKNMKTVSNSMIREKLSKPKRKQLIMGNPKIRRNSILLT